VGKVIVGIAALMFLLAAVSTIYSLIFGCPHGGKYRCEQRINRYVCGCPES
jgi:hypothetical protein